MLWFVCRINFGVIQSYCVTIRRTWALELVDELSGEYCRTEIVVAPNERIARKIDGKAVAADNTSGMSAEQITEKYDLIQGQFDRLLAEPKTSGLVKDRARCPQCGFSQAIAFDECPNCGVILAKETKADVSKALSVEEQDKPFGEWVVSSGSDAPPLPFADYSPGEVLGVLTGPSSSFLQRVGASYALAWWGLGIIGLAVYIGAFIIGIGVLREFHSVANSAQSRSKSEQEREAFLAAARTDNVKVATALLDKGVDVNTRGPRGKTALMVACSSGSAAVVRALLENGARVNTKDLAGVTALGWASAKDHPQIVALLKASGGEDLGHGYKNAALLSASEKGDLNQVRQWLEVGADINMVSEDGFTPLGQACMAGHVEVVRFLLDRGADDYLGNTLAWRFTTNQEVAKVLSNHSRGKR